MVNVVSKQANQEKDQARMWKSIALFLALGAVAAQVAHANVIATAESENLSLFKALADLAGATEALSNDAARVTVLAPTNEAVEAFLKEMDLTVDDLQKDETLVDKILGYHLIVGATAGPKELFASSDKAKVRTASAPFSVVFTKAAEGVTVTDFQGNVANVAKADLGTGKTRVHVIDRVLYSGAYWPSLAKLVEVLPGEFSTVKAAADAASLTSVLTEKGFSDTLFLPTNKAFEASGINLDAPAATVAEILKYHVVAGERTIPSGFESGKPVATLQGQDITVTYEQGDKVNERLVASTAAVTDASGKKSKVIFPNVFISKAAAHVIDGVLLPMLDAAAPADAAAAATTAEPTEATAEADDDAAAAQDAVAAATAADTAAASTDATAEPTVTVAVDAPAGNPSTPPTTAPEAPAEPTTETPAANPSAPPAEATSTSTGKGGFIAWILSLFHHKQQEDVVLTVSLPSGKGGRKLLQGGNTAQQFDTTSEMDATEQAILNSVNSGAAPGATALAGQAGVVNSELLSSYPADATWADGIDAAGYGGGGDK